VFLREAYKDVLGELLKCKDRTAELLTVALGVVPEGDPIGVVGVGVGAGHGGVLLFRQAYDEAEARWRRWGWSGPWCGGGPWPYGY
jgi:hypothetical protein